MKIFLALFISFACAAESQESRNETIEETSISRFNLLGPDPFYWIVTYLEAREVLSLKILSRDIYHRVRRLWPQMELSTIIDNPWPVDISVDFSHKIKICGLNERKENQIFPYNRAQLSCLQEFSLCSSRIHDFQTVINLLPKKSLTSLKLQNFGLMAPLIERLDFPKLTHLSLSWCMRLSPNAFIFLPNGIKVLELQHIFMDAVTSSSLATALGTMDNLHALSLSCSEFPKYEFSIILNELPTSLERLDINYIRLSSSDEGLAKFDLKRLKEIKFLQEIKFAGVDDELALEIILNLPEFITNIECDISIETLNAFKKRSGGFTNVKTINIDYLVYSDYPVDIELISLIQQVFPCLDDALKERLVKNRSL